MTTANDENPNVKSIYRLVDALNQGNFGIFDELISEDYRVGTEGAPIPPQSPFIPSPGESLSPESFKRGAIQLRRSFPDFQLTIQDVIASGDKVVVYSTATGSHKGDWRGISATNKNIESSNITIFTFAKGKIVGTWGLDDIAAVLNQVGVIPVVDTGIEIEQIRSELLPAFAVMMQLEEY